MKAAGLWVLTLCLASWGIAAWETVTMGVASPVSLSAALLFTATLAVWPYLAGMRVGPQGVHTVHPCRQCGATPVPAIPFCIHCGAFPRPAARAA